MFQKNLLFNEIKALQINNELEFEVKKNAIEGRIAWAKTVLNKIVGTSLNIDNKVDEEFRKVITQFQSANNLNRTSKLDFQSERLLLEKNGLSNLSDLDRNEKEIIILAKTKIEDWTDKAIITEEKKDLILTRFRDPRSITSLVLHHMAFKRKKRGGSFSNPENYLTTGAHFCIMFDGRIVQLHPMSRFVWHSNCTSPRSIGVEFEGNFSDINGKWWYATDKKTGKKIIQNEDSPTQAQFESGRFLLSYLKLILGLKHVLAHRQSSDDRENDPGPDIWFNVGEWGLTNLGLSDGGKDFKCGSGKPILDAWRKWNKISQPATSGIKSHSSSLSYVTPTRIQSNTVSEAVRSNRFYAKKLGWEKYIYKINDLLLPYSGQSNVSLGEEDFSAAVARWQKNNGFTGRDADGVIGPNTWRKLSKQLGIISSTAAISSPQSTSALGSVKTFGGISGKSDHDPILVKINQYNDLIVAAAKKYDLHPDIIRAIIAAESGGDRYKKSSANYKGLMQAEKDDDQYDPKTSIETGTKKFATFKNSYIMPRLKNFGIDANQIDQKVLLSLIIASYNAGQVTVLKALEYAYKSGDWRKWLEAENYQRALVFSGGYHTYLACSKNGTTDEIEEAKRKRIAYSNWRGKSNWQKFPDPPQLNVLNDTAPKIMMCWVRTKHKNTTPYVIRFLKYI